MQAIRFRCPTCLSAYSVSKEDIKSAKPQFKCPKCSALFWFGFPLPEGSQEAQTHLVEPEAPKLRPVEGGASDRSEDTGKTNSNESSTSRQPKSTPVDKVKPGPKPNLKSVPGGLNQTKEQESFPSPVVRPNPRLEKDWEGVLKDYLNEELHDAFIKKSVAAKALPFASSKYKEILTKNPDDQIALKMRDKLIQIATLTYVPPKSMQTKKPKKNMLLPASLIAIGLLLILGGLGVKGMRALIAVGAALGFMGFGIIYSGKK